VIFFCSLKVYKLFHIKNVIFIHSKALVLNQIINQRNVLDLRYKKLFQ